MNKGYTLIELVAVLVLVGVLAASATVSLLPMAEGLMLARANTTTLRKIQLAATRIGQEFATLAEVVSGDLRSITYDFYIPAAGGYATNRHTLSWSGVSGDDLMLQGVALSDDMADFALNYYSSSGTAVSAVNAHIIEVVLESLETGTRLTNRIAPRNVSVGE
jgi:prepilin-type N-terminal cleavage/methylation domain-containing protein